VPLEPFALRMNQAIPAASKLATKSLDHTVQFYSDDSFLTDELCNSLGNALSSGCSAVVIGTKAHNEALLRKLIAAGIDMSEAISRGQYQSLDASDVLSRFLIGGKLDESRFYETVGAILAKAIAASREPDRRVVAFGEMVALLWAENKAEEAILLEKMWNSLAKSYSFTLHCAYPVQGFGREQHADSYLKICAEHTLVIPEENRMASGPKDERRASAVHSEEASEAVHSETDWSKREERFRLLVDQVQDYAISMLDPDGNISSWNAGAERIKGYTRAEIIGRHSSLFYTPEDRASGKPQRLLRIAAEQGRVEDEDWRVRKNGEKFWARVTITAIRDKGGNLVGFGKVARDLTEHRRAEQLVRAQEERFGLFIDAVQDYALFMLDAQGYVRTWNRGAERIKGYKASEIIGRHFSVFFPPEDQQAGKPDSELNIAAKEGRFEDENWRVRSDGSKFWAGVVLTAIRDANGDLIGFGKVTRDLTERMLAQKSLEESRQKLEESEKSLRELSLHLLRTQDEERRRIGREIHDSLGQYLSVLKMKLDSMSPQTDELAQCGELVAECVREVRTISYLLYPPMLEEMGLGTAVLWYLEGFSKRSGIETKFSIPEDFDRLPRDVELVLFRVLQESLTNVQRHSGSKSAEIAIVAEGDSVMLEVSDQGKGLPPELLEQAGKDWLGSLGVGLRGMSERLRQLGGRLEISSRASGTKLRAIVPAAALRETESRK
jgi:PAS domain S-box-containing protein